MRLPDSAARYPRGFRQVMTTKDYRAMMITEQGRLLAAGYIWIIVGKSLGAGLWEVTLKREGG